MPTKEEIIKNIQSRKLPNIDTEEETEEAEEQVVGRKFVLVTNDFCALGWARQELLSENNSEVIVAYQPKEDEELEKEEYMVQGDGIIDKYPLDDIFERREEFKDWYWVWDGNHNYEYHDDLEQEGFKVLSMGGEFCYMLENDREFGLNFAEECGLESPLHQEFSSWSDGVKFLEEHEDKSFVFKPNAEDSSHLTTVPMTEDPAKANIEIRELLAALQINDFILQEKVKGVEVNVEVFYQKGIPVFAQANLENKRMHNSELGSNCGCAFDICWEISIDSPIALNTVRKFDDKLASKEYTGFADTNVIIGDCDKYYFLEFCFRTGYNAHPTLFHTISDKTYLQTMADLIDGCFEPKFKKGFGCSLTLMNDHFKMGIPIYVPETMEKDFFLFDGYMDDEHLLMGGYGKEIGIITAHNYTIETAFEECLDKADKIKFTNKFYRTDPASHHYQNSPRRRYDALQAMKLI